MIAIPSEASGPEPRRGGYARLSAAAGSPAVRESSPPAHTGVLARLTRRLAGHVERNRLGAVLPFTGFIVPGEPGRLLIPDLAFVTAARVPASVPGQRLWPVVPDLAIEVVSPGNTAARIQASLAECVAAGVRAVWVIDPRSRGVLVWERDVGFRVLGAGAVLEGGALVPGFSMPLALLFSA